MKRKFRNRRAAMMLTAVCAGLFAIGPATASADTTIQVTSDENTLGAALGPGVPDADLLARLDTPDLIGLSFSPVLVGDFGADAFVPSGAPAGTSVINIAPGDGENGYFQTTFDLPASFDFVQLRGAATVDDGGRVFLNGNAISPSLTSSGSSNFSFSTIDASLFRAGQNVILVSEENAGGGPSGAAFFATITTGTQPFPIAATWIGNDGNWSDSSKWSTNPIYPHNGAPADPTYDAFINQAP